MEARGLDLAGDLADLDVAFLKRTPGSCGVAYFQVQSAFGARGEIKLVQMDAHSDFVAAKGGANGFTPYSIGIDPKLR